MREEWKSPLALTWERMRRGREVVFMAALEFNAAYQTFIAFILAVVPGVALGWPLLKNSKMTFLEKFLSSFFIGLVTVPALLFIESLAGINFSLFLILINLFVLVAAGLFWGMKNGAFTLKFSIPEIDTEKLGDLKGFAWKHAATALLLIAVLLSFWIRIQTYGPIYSELDPYFYVFATGQIIQQGHVPLYDDTAWWPDATSSHRGNALRAYIEAQWYSVYTGGGAYDNHLLYTIAGWLPPICGALLAFGAYLAVSSLYGRRWGVLAAFAMVFLPIGIFKMSAGVNEAVPIGLMALFMCLGAYAYAAVKKDRGMALISGLAFFAVTTGSNYAPVLTIPFGAFMFLQSLDYYLREKPLKEFVEISAYPFAGLLIGALANGFDATGSAFATVKGLFGGYMLLAVAGFAFAAAVWYFSEKVTLEKKKRLGLAAVGAALVLILLIATPLGGIAKNMVADYVGAAQFNFPLDKTIAEQNQAGTSFEGEGGFLALVPSSHIDTSSNGIGALLSNIMYGALGLVSTLFTAIGNIMFKLIDMFFNTLFGTSISTGQKDDSLLFVFILIFTFGMIAEHFARKGEERETPSVMLLALLFVFPVLYVGINKIKFTIFAGIMVALAACMGLAALEKLLSRMLEKKEGVKRNLHRAFIALIALMILAEAFIPYSYTQIILAKSFAPRYQDNPAGVMPALATMCEQLKARGQYDADICTAGYEANYSNSLNNQYNAKICLVSQLTIDDIMPGNSTAAQSQASFDRTAASFRCNRLADYWVDSMEWISTSLDSSDRVTSWWDYGHWINYLGERKTVLRNEHASREMIGEIAHDYIDGTPAELAASMNHFDSRYALFDVELIGGSTFGGKYGALDYLSCAHDNLTSVSQSPGTSDCEFEHSPERIVVSKVQTTGTTCVISESQMRTGTLAFPIKKTGIDYANPAYCIGDVTLKGGQKTFGTYYLNKKDASGDLVLSKGFIRVTDDQNEAAIAEMVYDDSQVWPGPNGTWVGGMEDAKTKFYTSNLYQAFYLGKLAGFDLVYKSANGEVKIFRMKDSLFTGNKEGTGGIPGIKKLEQGS